MSRQKLVVIGAGMASARALEHVLDADDGPGWDVTLFNAEPRGSYNRIMLSPVLAGEKRYDEIVTHDDAWYAARGVTCHFGQPVTRINLFAKTISSALGEVSYDRLLIATGSTPFMLPLPGHELDGVIAYRDLDDTNMMIQAAAAHGARAVVIGGGLLGLEAAAGLAKRGMNVTVVHLMDHLMERQLDPAASSLLQKALEAKGIAVRLGTQSSEILGQDGHVSALRLGCGTELPCDLLVMAVGIRPNVALGKEAGLEVSKGIVVDDQMRTSDPSVFAIGECVEHRGALFGLVAPLYDQAAVVADTLRGRRSAFLPKALATKLKVTGCDLFSAGDFAAQEGREEIVLREPNRGHYRRLVLEGGRLVGAVIYGDTADGTWYHSLIRDAVPIGMLRETLIFGKVDEPQLSTISAPPLTQAWPDTERAPAQQQGGV